MLKLSVYTMSDPHISEKNFLDQLSKVIEENISDEQFGVSELATEIGMSRSNLLRKVKKLSGLSVSQYIRQFRLQQAMDLLKQDGLTVSEVAYQVGFNSNSYFIKCFREHFGYPPGEAEKRGFDESEAPSPGRSHQLAAIMFTDITGYTALMQQNEEKALQIRDRHREVFNSVTKKFKGKILQYYGDGTLSIFQSAIDAVKCGIELQLGFRLAPHIPVRIGIHSGDIIINEEEIIGDGVNIASRIESLAVPGSVFISGKIYDEVKNQSGIQTTSLGSFAFKNVEKPIEVFTITNPGLVVPARDQLGGKLKDRTNGRTNTDTPNTKKIWFNLLLIALAVLAAAYLLKQSEILDKAPPIPSSLDASPSEKSIAVLPFINDSNDSTNIYIINGLMESILDHLQKIEGLRVISRTSVEKYRNRPKIIPEIAEELGVRYFVEGSGQKIGDQIMLNIQLIEAPSDRHLWSGQYDRQVANIFSLQQEIAKKIADEIQVFITPEVEERIDKIPTENMEAYDAFLKGLDLIYQGDPASLKQAIGHYEKAIGLDPEFARAHAGIAIAYYFLDFYGTKKEYSEQINYYADKALLLDPQLAQSLIAKAVYYMHLGDNASAIPHLEKALEYNPNSALVINILSDFYSRFMPNTAKYLEYALKGIRLDIASHDSTTASFIFLHLSNAFVQSGFVEEAEKYINRSLAYDPENLYAAYVKAFILYARNRDLRQTKALLMETLQKDTNQLDVLQEVAKVHYFLRDYAGAYHYYKKFTGIREALKLDVYQVENAKIAVVMRKTGQPAAAEKYIQDFRNYTTNDQSIYRELNHAMLYAFEGAPQKAIERIKQFSDEENYHYWILLFFELDPLMDDLKTLPAFKKIMRDIEKNFWDRHQQIKTSLEEQGLL